MSQKPGGIAETFGPLGHVEVMTSTCSHCQKITDIPTRRKMFECVEVCRGCMKLICLDCAGKGCTPFMKVVEQMEKEGQVRDRFLRDVGA